MSAKLVKDIMHRGVIACHPGTAVTEVVRVLADTEVHAIVVTGPEGQLVGIISHMDVIPLYGQSLEGKTAADIMTPNVVTADLQTPVSDAVRIMVDKRIHRLVVTDAAVQSPTGILSTTDIVREMRGSRWMWYFSPNP